MDSSTIARYLSKLLIEDDETEIIRFEFPNETRKIKSSKSFLSKISPVFKTMLGETWLTDTTIKLEDQVKFDQYVTFKLFLEIIYELFDVNMLSVEQAIEVYHYADKYEVTDLSKKIRSLLNKRMESSVSKNPVSVAELTEGLHFAELYQLDEFKKKLDKVALDFNEENPALFFDLAVKFGQDTLKEQIIQHLKTIEPNDTWTLEISNSVVKCLQEELRKEKMNRSAFEESIGSIKFGTPVRARNIFNKTS